MSSSSPSGNKDDDDLMAPIPRKKRPSEHEGQNLGHDTSNSSLILPTIPRKSSSLNRRPSSSGVARPTLQEDPSIRQFSTLPKKKKERKSFEHKTSYSEPEERISSLARLSARSKTINVVSESPLLLRIQVPPGLFPHRSSQRQKPKRSRPQYKEAELTDSDDFVTDDEAPPKKKGRLVPFSAIASKRQESPSKKKIYTEDPPPVLAQGVNTQVMGSPDGLSPPEGVLNTLWYSREAFLNIFVLEKALGYNVRPIVRLVKTRPPTPKKEGPANATSGEEMSEPSIHLPKEANLSVASADAKVGADAKPETPLNAERNPSASVNSSEKPLPAASPMDTSEKEGPIQPEPYVLDNAAAIKIQQTLLQNEELWQNQEGRIEISRLVPQQCPVVLTAAAIREEYAAREEGREPAFKIAETSDQEEVLLVKWRGRSYMHCSWERPSDIQRADTSNNSTARNKIRRYYQAQELALGFDWKKVLTKKELIPQVSEPENTEGEDYFSPQCLEVERILSCDESEMSFDVLAKQRGKNMQAEQEALQRREAQAGGKNLSHESSAADAVMAAVETISGDTTEHSIRKLLTDLPSVLQTVRHPPNDESWDPEDNVRYVVKWKGLPYAEITWEYWRDIKRDAVTQAEDFWYRQCPPKEYNQKQHPHVRDFKKLQESPAFGLSTRERPCIGFEDGNTEEDAFSGFKLRSYQLEGVNWLLFNWWNKRSCVLADEMGLGKTIQSTAFLRALQTNENTQIRGPFLIVAPLSLAGQWQSELASWAPDMNVVLYHGSEKARNFLVQEEFYYKEPFVTKAVAAKMKKAHVTKFDVLITTYEIMLKESAVLSKLHWKVLIVDEAHRLKNHTSRLFDELASVPRDHCVLLTGTPIANATEELWALLHFANPQAFDDREDFLGKFGQMTDAQQVNELHALLRPFLLRRVKEDVEKSLPPKEETILEVTLTPIQKAYYKAIYERNTSFLFKGAKANNAPSLMNVMMELRKCCNHPFLVKGAEERILTDAANKLKEKEAPPADMDYTKIFGDQIIKSSGKMVLIEKLLQKLLAGGHKVLIFSQMVRVLDILEEFLKLQKYRYERLDGSTSSSSRSAAVDRFTRKSFKRFVMLLSTRAGGLGLNLTAADTVIIFDSDWNPQNDLQAMARAHRIGQERRVLIYRLLTAKTYEMHMFHSASLKLGLERAVLSQNRDQNDDSEDKSKKKRDRDAQAKQIDELLKKGAYDVFRQTDDDDREAEKFMETDIDQLLAHSSKTVTYGASATSSLGSGLGSFSKASFVTETDDGAKDVDLDDPDFWSKAVGLDTPVETPEEIAAMIDDGVKRSRKQVEVYDPYAETAQAEKIKQEKIALEKMLEKEEKERQRLEKKAKKEAAKEKRKKEREEQQKLKEKEIAAKQAAAVAAVTAAKPITATEQTATTPVAKVIVKVEASPKKPPPPPPPPEPKPPKKSKKSDRQRALKRAENENPILEQLRQAWEAPQRNRASAAFIRFGFGRFCKIRHEANLTSLPLQDVEIFARSYIYQIALQVGVTFLSFLRENDNDEDELRLVIRDWLGSACSPQELDFICESVATVMESHAEVELGSRLLRLPAILAEPTFVSDLRKGAALRALRRIGVLATLNRFIEGFLDQILTNLGHEELGKRGCAYGDLSCLDVDLKARFVTTEELTLFIGANFKSLSGITAPTLWWDLSCDVCLLLGTFIHGLGNYKAIAGDPDLCFSRKMKAFGDTDSTYKSALANFKLAAKAARKVFDDALEAGRVKAELEVQAAVAAAARAAKKREEDAQLLRQGGEGVEAAIKNMPETQVENAFEFDGTDSHFVTLQRMQEGVRNTVASKVASQSIETDDIMDISEDGATTSGRSRPREHILMPDARVLDHRVLLLLSAIEGEDPTQFASEPSRKKKWRAPDHISANIEITRDVFESVLGNSYKQWANEFSGVGLGSYQCGSTHRTLNDGSDYGHGSATQEIAQVAYGTDAPRYLRQLGVPMNLTRYAVCSLVHVDSACVEELLKGESLKFYGNEMGKADQNQPSTPGTEYDQQAPQVEMLDSATVTFSKAGESATENSQNVEDQETTKEAGKDIEKQKEFLSDPTTEKSASADRDTKKEPTRDKTKDEAESVVSTQNGNAQAVPSGAKLGMAGFPTGLSNEESKANTERETENDADKDTKQSLQFRQSAAPALSKVEPSFEENQIEDKSLSLIPSEFRKSAKLRALTCLAVLFNGHPSKNPGKVHPGIMALADSDGKLKRDSSFFDQKLLKLAMSSLGSDADISESLLCEYIDKILLPHCLKLCLYGNGPTTRDARGSQGEYDTAYGVCTHPEHSMPRQTPIPDPLVPLEHHSTEAVCHASAILRRVRLLRACQYICSGKDVGGDQLETLVKSKQVCDLQELPVWWCPWLHDIALIVQVATKGLFSITGTRNDHPIFAPAPVEAFLRSSLTSSGSSLPGSNHTSPAKVDDWIWRESLKFPNLQQIERRLSLVCDIVTSTVTEGPDRYCNLPMFDHGGFPRL
mmetsp:Transcript_14219/g.29472  ORF Transcript_14219/g.29472 Transcript_14219/m.29472 type:complete len:2502 (-) Transcript_14219:1540-9045(-)